MKKILLAFLLLPLSGLAQKDTSFWFAAPEIVEFLTGNPHDKPLLLRLTSFGSAANVTISLPANPSFTPINTSIGTNATVTVDLSAWDNQIENAAANTIANKGILIRSTADITVYYEVKSTCNCNPELFALKGKSALGNEFIIASQKEWPIDTVRFPTARSAFNIVATENNTTLTITPSQPLIGRPAGIPFTITLNRGQSFSNQGLYRNGPSLLNGSIVLADKPVSVTASEDLLMSDGPCADLAGDQLIPTSIWGNEFVAIRGALTNKDKVIITAMANGTAIYLNGNATPTATINRGQSFESNLTASTLYIKTSNKVSVYHYTGINCEIGSAVIPKINCTGSQDVAITRSINENAEVFIVTRQGFQGNFSVNGSNAIITAADFATVPGTGGAYVFCKKNMNSLMSTGVATRFVNNTGKFSLGFLNGATPTATSGCRYGYFSDFKSSSVNTSQQEICLQDSAQLLAFGGISYQWSPSVGLSNPNVANPKASPPITTDYKVIITTVEGCIDSAFVKVIVNNCLPQALDCNTWLATPSPASYAEIGDLDVAGNTMTVEAVFNRTAPYTGGNLYAGNLVSKHNHPTTVNYLLRPNSAEITTSNGYFITQAPCEIELNKTYHVAMVYDGSTLKFYRNGFLMSQTPVTGNLFQNDLRTRIGWLDFTPLNESFIGYINEVRIWNVARTQTQLQTYMNSTLPGPTTQTGLLGYYSFDNLSNKQGNATFNATLAGAAAINQTNTNCPLVVDSCAIAAPDSLIVNNYTPVISLDICKNIINVEDASEFNIGDTVLMIQMKGAVIDSTNTAAFGSITDYKNAGNYEFNYVKSKSGNNIELLNVLLRQYDLPNGKVQLVRVPYYLNTNFDKVVTCLPWDGSKGGVLAINVRDTVSLGANMDVSGRGFRGGIDPFSNPGPTVYNCYENNFFYPVNPDLASGKGEGIALISAAKSFGKGALANGGGGGNSHNSGGGGGSNGNPGGFGGYSFEGSPCNGTVPFNNRGIGGYQLPYNNAQNKIFLGGGGGAGHSNNPQAFEAIGGNGAGIIILSADKIKANTNRIIANGNNGVECGTNTGGCHEGMGGGGAAGTVLLNINTYLDNTITEVKGGKGANMTSAGNLRVGPGGGGSGGISWFKQAAAPVNLSIINTGGIAGVCTGYANNPWGATAGANGTSLGTLVVPVTTTLFKPNIDSVRFSSTPTSCSAFDFNGQGYTNTQGIASWQWYFGDGGTATTQNTAHSYSTTGTFDVKLVVTDINGCKDSITRPVNTNTLNVFAGNDAAYCSNTAVTHTLNGSGDGTIYNWQPAAFLNDNSLANPVATITTTTKFYLTHSNASGCSAVDSVLITINPVPVMATIGDTSLCSNTSLTLSATGAASYSWSPVSAVNNPSIANPLFIGNTDQTMTVTGTNAEGCSAVSSFDVVVKAAPVVNSIPDSILCGPRAIVLSTNGAQTYSWSPANGLSDAGIANPVFTGTTGNYTYTVTGTAANGCSASAIVNVTVNPVPTVNSFGDTAVCSNRSLQLIATGAASYVWSPAAAVSNPNISNPVFTATGNQTITVTGTNAQGCSDTHSFNVNYNIAPVITTIPDSTICNTQSIVLTSTGAQTWSWSPATNLSDPNIASPVFSGTAGNTYTVTGTAANGCSNTDMVTISTIAPGVFNTPPDKTVCINSSVVLDGNNGNGVSYQWSPAATLNNTNTINPTATPVLAGNNVYTLVVSETVCNSSRSFQVNVLANPLPNVTASRANDLDCAIRSTGLSAGGAVSYTWTPAATLNNPSIATPVASPTANTTYTVVGTDANGCKNDGTVTVLVKGTEGRFDIPNAFTPNGDGKNDCFGVKHWGDATVFHFMIFNRWGEKVFETKDINNCWDGRYKGQPADIGNYVYYIKSVNFCGEQVKKGNVILIR